MPSKWRTLLSVEKANGIIQLGEKPINQPANRITAKTRGKLLLNWAFFVLARG
jgi:hypothetical protein